MARGSRNWIWPGVVRKMLPEGIGLPCMIVIWGVPGCRKSSFAMQAANDWCVARKKNSAIFLPFEMGMGVQLGDMVRRFEATEVHFRTVDTWADVLDTMKGYRLVVCDSLQASGADPDEWRSVTVDHGRSLILVSQANSDGGVKGGLAASHIADISIEMKQGGAYIVRKNRSGPCTEGLWLEPEEM